MMMMPPQQSPHLLVGEGEIGIETAHLSPPVSHDLPHPRNFLAHWTFVTTSDTDMVNLCATTKSVMTSVTKNVTKIGLMTFVTKSVTKLVSLFCMTKTVTKMVSLCMTKSVTKMVNLFCMTKTVTKMVSLCMTKSVTIFVTKSE